MRAAVRRGHYQRLHVSLASTPVSGPPGGRGRGAAGPGALTDASPGSGPPRQGRTAVAAPRPGVLVLLAVAGRNGLFYRLIRSRDRSSVGRGRARASQGSPDGGSATRRGARLPGGAQAARSPSPAACSCCSCCSRRGQPPRRRSVARPAAAGRRRAPLAACVARQCPVGGTLAVWSELSMSRSIRCTRQPGAVPPALARPGRSRPRRTLDVPVFHDSGAVHG